jgi:transmembrane sensor
MRIAKHAGDIDSAAADWAIRTDRGLTPEETRALESWLGADTRHAGAFARAQAMLMPVPAGIAVVVGESRGAPAAARNLPRRAMLAAAAAVVCGGYAVISSGIRKPETYATKTGEVRTVPLADGSRITLNTDTRIDVTLGDTARQLALESGEAFFEVAPNAARSFTVDVADIAVKAIGTAFIVRRKDDGDIEVVVHEGTVEIKGQAGKFVTLTANMRAVVEDRRRVRVATLDHEALSCSLAWRDGKIAFTGETLAEAVREFNRYNVLPVHVVDAGLARRTVTGWFSSRDPEAFAQAIALSFDGAVRVHADRIELVAR